MDSDLCTFPEGWVWARLGEIAEKLVDGSHNPPPQQVSGVPMLSARNIDNDRIVFSDFRYISETDFEKESERAPIEADDVLLTIVGTIGRSAVVKVGTPKFSVQRSVAVIRTKLLPQYLSYLLQSPRLNQHLIREARGTAQKGIYLNQLKDVPIPVAPFSEQQRIVGKIDGLFSFLAAGTESLRRIEAQLKRYRQAVLKYAFEGKLTEEWRRTHKHQIEPASMLLKRLTEEKKGIARGKYEELAQFERQDWPLLPEEWEWVSLGIICKVIYRYPTFYGLEHLGTGVPVIRVGHIGDDGTISNDWNTYWFVSEEVSGNFPRTVVEVGDIIMSVRGSIGKFGIIDSKLRNAQISPNCLRISLYQNYVSPRFLLFYFKSFFGQGKIKELISSTTVQTIKADLITKILIPLPPFLEQEKTVEEIERRFSVIYQMERTFEQSLSQADRLRQTILKKAFEGKLVPQDPADEPADKLLERIREERAKSKDEKDTNKGRKNKPRQLELSSYVE
jgi:type I restriction enzyme S subunit